MDANQDVPPPEGTAPPWRAGATGAADAPGPGEPAMGAGPDEAAARAERQRAADQLGGTVRTGLLRWTALVSVASLAAMVFGHADAALLFALSGLFALAQAWDARDRARTGDPVADLALEPGTLGMVLRALVPLAMPFAGVLLFSGLAMFAAALPRSAAHVAALQWSIAAAVVSLGLAFPPFTRAVARAFVPDPEPGHVARLTATMAVVLLLLPVPFVLLSDELLDYMKSSGRSLADVGLLAWQLAGEVMFALAAVGLWVARDARAVARRLGLGGIPPRHLVVGAIGLVAVIAGNGGMEWIERTWLPALWARDQDMVRLIAGSLTVPTAVLLGLSAGVGEEVLVRGALQPRVGLLWASVLFAAGHVQYTWFGMLTIVVLGLLLGTVRKQSNTTTAIVVHALYDIFAALGTR